LQRSFECLWPQAGVYLRSDQNHYTIFGAAKGGVLKVFDKQQGKLLFSSLGYTGRLAGGKEITTHLWSGSPALNAGNLEPGHETDLSEQRKVGVNAPFFIYRSNRLMKPLAFLAFRAFNLTLGRIRQINDWVRRNLVIGRFLTARLRVQASLQRTVAFDKGAIELNDEITAAQSIKLTELREHGFFSTIYMASARYFRLQDLAHAWSSPNLAQQVAGGRLIRKLSVCKDRGDE
jgi:hypothetical protein